MRARPLSLLITVAFTIAHAQSHPDCPARPTTLAAMRSCYRPLLVFASSAADLRLARQQAILDQDADDMMDRNVLMVPMPFTPASLSKVPLPLDTPYALLPPSQVAEGRKRFHVAPGAFVVILLGEDGGEKLRSSAPVEAERLNALIDTMPTRRREMQQPHTN